MRKILSLLLLLCICLTATMLPSCKKNTDQSKDESSVETSDEISGETSSPAVQLPATYTDLINLSAEKTMAAFFSEEAQARFDMSKGVKAELVCDLEKIAGFKFDADLVATDSYVGFDIGTLKSKDVSFDGIKFAATKEELVFGMNGLLSQNYGFKFAETAEQISKVIQKLNPDTPYETILAQVQAYIAALEAEIGNTDSGTSVTIDPEIAKKASAALLAFRKGELSTSGTDIVATGSYSLQDCIDAINEVTRILNEDPEARILLEKADAALKEAIAEDGSIPAGVTTFEYFVSTYETVLAAQGLSFGSFVRKAESTVDADMRLKSGKISYLVNGESFFTVEVTAKYDNLPAFTATATVSPNEQLGITDNSAVRFKFEKTAANATSSGFKITVENANDTVSTVDDYSAYAIEYTKDSSNNVYEVSLFARPVGVSEYTLEYGLKGKAYENKDEWFCSVDQLTIGSMGVSVMIDCHIRLTAPAQSDMNVPSYTGIGNMTDADLNALLALFESIFGKEGEAEPDHSDTAV